MPDRYTYCSSSFPMGTMISHKILKMILFSLALGLVMALSPYHRIMNPDTMMVYFSSLIRWTPYFWGQDRYGMLLPLLTSWLDDPYWTIILQNTFHSACSILCFFLLPKLLFPRSNFLATGLLSLALFIGFSGTLNLFNFFTPWQIYTPGLLLGLVSLLVLQRSFLGAFLLMGLAQWACFSTGILLGLLILFQQIGGNKSNLRIQFSLLFKKRLVLIGSAMVAGILFQVHYLTHQTSSYASNDLLQIVYGWTWLIDSYIQSPLASNWLLVGPLFLASAAMLVVAYKNPEAYRKVGDRQTMAVAAMLAILFYIVIVGGSVFARSMGFPQRYLIPALIVWSVIWSAVLLEYIKTLQWDLFSPGNHASKLAALLIVLLTIFRFGLPSVEGSRNSIQQAIEPKYKSFAEHQCTHALGFYYVTWPAYFYTLLNEEKAIWPITHRSEVIKDMWAPTITQNSRICYWKDYEEDALKYREEHNLPELVELEDHEIIKVLQLPAKTKVTGKNLNNTSKSKL